VEQRAHLGVNHINKFNFLKAFPAAQESAFKQKLLEIASLALA
jgi:hypothetical protein